MGGNTTFNSVRYFKRHLLIAIVNYVQIGVYHADFFLFEIPTMKTRKCTLLITYSCNLNCIYCYERYKSSDPKKTMSFDTATRIIQQEIGLMQSSKKFELVEFNFFGGEPLLQFPLIRSLVEWAEAEHLTDKCYFTATSNGTLVSTEIMNWCTQHKTHFALGLSVDGIDEIQRLNRGCDIEKIPIEFAQRTWPERPFKMTISRQSLPTFAQNVLGLQNSGYELISSLADGAVAWTDEDAAEYGRQLRFLAEFYLSHQQKKPMHLFLRSLPKLLDGYEKPQHKRCGVGDYTIAYDIDGTPYPCIALTPIVTRSFMNNPSIDFISSPLDFQDPDCNKCILRNECPTCYGQNFIHRKAFALRDHNCCKMYKTELQVVAQMQIDYLRQANNPLNAMQQQRLQAAEQILKMLDMH